VNGGDAAAKFHTDAHEPDVEPPYSETTTGLEHSLRERSSAFYSRLLLLFVAAYVLVSFVLASLRFTGFFAENWDFGIFQQALWSTSHGHILFEAGDYELLGVASFFQVHPSFMMFSLAGVYALLPSPFTLLAIQSLVVGFAAVPLYWLTGSITGSRRKAIWVAVAYLIWLPLLSSQLYDFHLESFLPLELFSMFLLWYRGRYWSAATVATLSMLTLEVAPLFVFATALFFALPPLRSSIARFWRGLRLHYRGTHFPPLAQLRQSLLGYLSDPKVLFSWVMAEFSVGMYIVLRLFQGPWIDALIGSNVGPTGSNWGFSTSSLGLSFGNLGSNFPMKVEYWLILYGLLLLIPLIAPRTLLLALPWLVYTFFSAIPNYVTIGYQYGTVAAFPVFVGLAYAMNRITIDPLGSLPTGLPGTESSRPRGEGNPRAPPVQRPRRKSQRLPFGTFAMVGIVLGGVLLSPITPWNLSSAIPENIPPGYWGRYSVPAGYAKVVEVAALVPSGASVLASTDLFPFVANNVNAYATLWYPADPPYLPFNVTDPPRFVLVSQVMWANLPSWIGPLLSNQNTYGLRGYVPVTPLGWVRLFENQYLGNATTF
jgi:uncharacterized membrane protein